MNSRNARGNIMILVLIVLAVGSITVVLVPKIASDMGTSYQRAIIESAWRTMSDKLRLSMRNPGWVTCNTHKRCDLKKEGGKEILAIRTENQLAEMAKRFNCGPSGQINYCKFGIRTKMDPATGLPVLNIGVESTDANKVPSMYIQAYFDTAVPPELVGKVHALPVSLSDIELRIDVPRGIVVSDSQRFMCSGFLMGYKPNGEPICKNITTKRQEVGRYITSFEYENMDKGNEIESDRVPEAVKDCLDENKFLLSYKWIHSIFYEHKCGTRVEPWMVN